MKFGVALGLLNPAFHFEVAEEAERLGYESVWLPEHLVFPRDMSGSPHPGEHQPPVAPTTPVFDCFSYLAFIAGRSSRIRLGTHVYLMGLRHPFAAARAVQTLDHVSGGRAEIGIGAGWLEAEWRAAGQDFGRRGACLDECLRVCKRLWTEDEVEHHGEFFDFQPVVFEPKPLQKPWPPILVGGESRAALRRAALFGDGWIGMGHSLESIKEPLAALARLRQQAGTAGNRFAVTVSARLRDRGEVALWEEAGVDRILVAPWKRSPEAAEAIRRFADVTGMEPQA